TLAADSAQYIPSDWFALIEIADSELDGVVRFARSSSDDVELLGQRISLLGLFDHPRISGAAAAAIPDLRAHVVNHGESRMARELVRADYRSALLVPLTSERSWRGLLVFASMQAGAYSADQVKLMANLSPTLAAGLARNAGATGPAIVSPEASPPVSDPLPV
ncbi:MAG: hypothetical protein CVU23_11840, partial [Betaproteobacteria bacterium HGW-Betaproteobacteria-17]